MDEIDCRIVGDDMQWVEIELDPHEGVRAEVGSMMHMDQGYRNANDNRWRDFQGL